MRKILFLFFILPLSGASHALALPESEKTNTFDADDSLKTRWENPPSDALPWVVWHWMQGAVSETGITADLEAMKAAGIGGAYLMSIKGVPDPPFVEPVVEQLSPRWWSLVKYAFQEADRIGVQLGFHICDGFALAGGPWIDEEKSMQKIVHTQVSVTGDRSIHMQLQRPEAYNNYYRDIAIFAYPTLPGEDDAETVGRPTVMTHLPDIDASFLTDAGSRKTFRSDTTGWILYTYAEPFTCRSVCIRPAARNLQAQRLWLETSDDGVSFKKLLRMEPPRQGWQNDDYPLTYSLPPTTARYFRFSYDPEGMEPGAEDLDAAKWKQGLRIHSIALSGEASIHQYEGKNGSVWRVAPHTQAEHFPRELSIDRKQMIDLTQHVDTSGYLQWEAPAGRWTILRMGHTSTGHTNATGGKGSGLECDKFDAEVVRLQFRSWFGKAIEMVGDTLASRVLKMFYVDSWECGGQNWSPTFRAQFLQRRGYDVYDYLPVLVGKSVENIEQSEAVLFDVRQTIADLIVDVFYKTLHQEAQARGCLFSAESVAPTMPGDGMMHYRYTDIPMGEYWVQSPTHDKPNDMLDAISAAHIYGHKLVQAEAFTQLRTTFDEHPGMLKVIQDRNYAMGVNRIVYHVCVLNPWTDRQPGMTLDGIGLYFQRDQIWWKHVGAWTDYAARCHVLLQTGQPVVDLAVFTGDELPRRALTPDRLVPFLPAIVGAERVEREKTRLANRGLPTRQMPLGVSYHVNSYQAEDWIDPLRGYAYDSFHPDALAQAGVEDGVLVLPSGMRYRALLVPGKHPMQPHPEAMRTKTREQLAQLEARGATLLHGIYPADTLPFAPDCRMWEAGGTEAAEVAYTHRRTEETDIYFIANQQNRKRDLTVSLRVTGREPELWNPVDGSIRIAETWKLKDACTEVALSLDAAESVFIVLRRPATASASLVKNSAGKHEELRHIGGPWAVQFDTGAGGPERPVVFPALTLWNEQEDAAIRYYSGTAIYSNAFEWEATEEATGVFLTLDSIYHTANIRVNGIDCGTLWTYPYRLDIRHALQPGINRLEIEVANSWANRLLGNELFGAPGLPPTWTNARYRGPWKQAVPAGLAGEVKLIIVR
jgi:hypothetical protein